MRYKKQFQHSKHSVPGDFNQRCVIQFSNNMFFHKDREKRWVLDKWFIYPKEDAEPRKVSGYMNQPATLHSIRYYKYSEEGIPARIKR
ncbi:MAG: hypothetical protein EB127_20265 [Alphaproteobacteria bacterium]|nr:hypothetical protein [Alphaproteobacteria bacterium]